MKKILFILKRKEDYNKDIDGRHVGLSTGLYNSAGFMNDMLLNEGIVSKMVVVQDNNCIDREVTKFRPTHVIIEALWVVPEKFAILTRLHPDVTWIIRVHSETPFLAGEGSAFGWLGDYSSVKNIVIGVNAPRMLEELRFFLAHKNNWSNSETSKRVIYLPNYYPAEFTKKPYNNKKDSIDIGCFGAVRPLKNHTVQAIAALKFADYIGKPLNFHINADRVEMNGGAIIHSLSDIFQVVYNQGHRLVNHTWSPHYEFIKTCAKMDIGMQVSFSETFNIVAADLISTGVPVVGSTELPWAKRKFCADPVNSEDIFQKLLFTHKNAEKNVDKHQQAIIDYSENSRYIWAKYFKG